jgi:hypothetical protein
MKKFLAITTAVLFIGLLALSLVAYAEDDPRKQKSASAATEQCEKHTDTAEGKTEAKACCKESGEKASASGQQSSECKNKSDASASAQ